MIDCSFFDNGICRLASSKAQIEVPTYESTCKACMEGHYVIDGLVTVQLHKLGRNHKTVIAVDGVGSVLAEMIKWFPIPKKKDCTRCNQLKIKMNNWGPEMCRQKSEYIIRKLHVGWVRRFGPLIPFPETLAKSCLERAILKVEAKT